MQTTIAIILVLGILIAFHELGHFLAARMFGIGVRTFALGFGPRVFGVTHGKTDYRLALIPLGGYVQLVGDNREEELPEGYTEAESFLHHPAWHRMIVVFAGPLFNFILAWFIYWGVFFNYGAGYLVPEIGVVSADTPAQAAGLQVGDLITGIDGQEVGTWTGMSELIKASEGRPLTVTISRKGQESTLTLTPEMKPAKNMFGETYQRPIIGVMPSGKEGYIEHTLASSAGEAVHKTLDVIGMIGQSFLKLVQAVVPMDKIGGPIMIAELVHQQTKEGLLPLLMLTAAISINLGVLNLLPIPVLDGGHILFFSIETIIRRPVPERIQELTTRMGLAFLLLLMLVATYNDLARHFPWLSVY